MPQSKSRVENNNSKGLLSTYCPFGCAKPFKTILMWSSNGPTKQASLMQVLHLPHFTEVTDFGECLAQDQSISY